MSGGQRYWNEETQRWQDDDPSATAPVTPPPPARPAFTPTWPAPTTDWPPTAPRPTGPPPNAPHDPAPAAGSPAGGGTAPPWPAAGSAAWPPAAAGPDGVTAPTAGATVPTVDAGGAGPAGGGAETDPDAPTAVVGAPVVGPSPGTGPTPSGGWSGGWHGPVGGDGGAWAPTEVDAGGGPDWPAARWPPVQEPPPAPATVGGMSRRVVWSVLIGAAAVGVAVSLVLTLVVDKGDDGKGKRAVAASGSPTPGPTGPTRATESPTGGSPSPTASPSSAKLPAGYEEFEDDEGFRIARPEGWTRSTVASSYGIAVVNYRSADGRHRLQVYQVAEESPDASFDLYLSAETPKPAGFHKLALKNLDDGEFTGSRLEYLADSLKGEPDIGTWHVYDERFVSFDGTIYAIAVYGPDSDGGDDELKTLTTALDWFCPSPGACDAAAVD
ncbi:hypothetical protein ABZT03_34470 [Streptomyces sp. NPDC005574]|uniref:hypothetical protein n=1 Tax=Streptomyces sp. NPDC005574 TaxID=3156891 RepID=UPI0033AA581D